MPEETNEEREPEQLSIRMTPEFWPMVHQLRKWYRTDNNSALFRLLIEDAYNMATGNGVPATSPLAPSVIQERKNASRQDGIEVA